MRRYYIIEGDKTTANGIVQKHIGAGSTTSWHGRTVSNIGDKVHCPACKSVGIIQSVGDRNPFGNKGFIPALNDDFCICKCSPPPKLIHSQTVFYQDFRDVPNENNIENLNNQSNLTNVDSVDYTQLVLVDEKGNTLANYHYKINFDNGTILAGQTNNEGKTEMFDNSKKMTHIWYQINKGVEV